MAKKEWSSASVWRRAGNKWMRGGKEDQAAFRLRWDWDPARDQHRCRDSAGFLEASQRGHAQLEASEEMKERGAPRSTKLQCRLEHKKGAERDKTKPRRMHKTMKSTNVVGCERQMTEPDRKIHNVFVPSVSGGESGSQCCCGCTSSVPINGCWRATVKEFITAAALCWLGFRAADVTRGERSEGLGWQNLLP